MKGETEKRTFESWSMGFVNMDKKGEYPNYREYINEYLNFRDFDEEAEEAYDFICAFDKYNYWGVRHWSGQMHPTYDLDAIFRVNSKYRTL